jgi:hypothetical protein
MIVSLELAGLWALAEARQPSSKAQTKAMDRLNRKLSL